MSAPVVFAQNSMWPSACPHAEIMLKEDAGITILCCRTCLKRWTYVPIGEFPYYFPKDSPLFPGQLDNRGWKRAVHVIVEEGPPQDSTDPAEVICSWAQDGQAPPQRPHDAHKPHKPTARVRGEARSLLFVRSTLERMQKQEALSELESRLMSEAIDAITETFVDGHAAGVAERAVVDRVARGDT